MISKNEALTSLDSNEPEQPSFKLRNGVQSEAYNS